MDVIVYDPTKPSEMFNDLVSDEDQRKITEAIISQYKSSYEHCYGNFADAEARDLLPHYRRVCIEGVMPDLAARIGSCVAKSRKNKAKNCSHRLMIRNRIILTQSKVEQEGILPRNAEFRKGYAESPQMDFGFMIENEVLKLDHEACLYAIITHMPLPRKELFPAFVNIVFPDKSYKSLISPSIELLNKFPDIIPMFEMSQEEIIPDKIEVKLGQGIKENNSKTA